MSNYAMLTMIGIIGLGVYLTYLLNKISDLEEQLELYNETVLGMAKELQELGSPNVKIILGDNDEK